MKIRIVQYIQLDKQPDQRGPSPRIKIYKEYESNIIPHTGDFISDSAFFTEKSRKIDKVTVDYSENLCEVTLTRYMMDGTLDELEQHVQEMVDRSWVCPKLK